MTTPGNCQKNEAAIVYAFGEPGPDTYSAVICGDDFLLIGRPPIVDRPLAVINEIMSHIGFEVTYFASNDSANVEFVSLLPYPTADGTVLGPKIGRQLHRAGWTTSSEKSDIYGAAVSMSSSVSFIPFLKEYFAVHRQLASPLEEHRVYDRIAMSDHAMIPATWEFVERRYGLTIENLAEFESLLDRVVSLPVVIDWVPINDLVERDS